MPTILSIMELSGLPKDQWPCEWHDGAWLVKPHDRFDDTLEALFAHALRKAIRERVGDEGAEIRVGHYSGTSNWCATVCGDFRSRHSRTHTKYSSELAALAALYRAVSGKEAG